MARVEVGLSAVIVAVTDEVPRVVTVRSDQPDWRGDFSPLEALPFGDMDPEADLTLELALRRWVAELSGLALGYVEQLYTFGDLHRDPVRQSAGARTVAVAYLALVRHHALRTSPRARWRDWHSFFPWEDWREGRPKLLSEEIVPALLQWCATSTTPSKHADRRQRIDIAFGLEGAPWDEERVLDRYELLYEATLVSEALRDADARGLERPAVQHGPLFGRPLALDHRRILASAMGRLRGKLKYRPVVFELLPAEFTLFHLQRVVEALAGTPLHKQNFRRLIIRGGLVEGTGNVLRETGGRPAELFCFRRSVLRERPAPGVGLPGLRSSEIRGS